MDSVPRRFALPDAVQALFAARHPAWGLRLEHKATSRHAERFRFQFETFSEVSQELRTVEGEYFRARTATPAEPGPLVLDSPILAGAHDGYLADRIFSGWATARGFSTLFLYQEEDVLAPARDATELSRSLRESVISYRKALDLILRERPELDPERLASFGISMGAIRNVVLAAVEPRLKANVFCLVGGNLPRVLRQSRERLVRRYVARRESEEGISQAGIAEEFEREFLGEPLRFAASIPPEQALLFLGSFDDKVPYDCGLELREAMGRPELRIVPLGHYTGILYAPIAARRGFAWMREVFARKTGA